MTSVPALFQSLANVPQQSARGASWHRQSRRYAAFRDSGIVHRLKVYPAGNAQVFLARLNSAAVDEQTVHNLRLRQRGRVGALTHSRNALVPRGVSHLDAGARIGRYCSSVHGFHKRCLGHDELGHDDVFSSACHGLRSIQGEPVASATDFLDVAEPADKNVGHAEQFEQVLPVVHDGLRQLAPREVRSSDAHARIFASGSTRRYTRLNPHGWWAVNGAWFVPIQDMEGAAS